MICSGGGKVKKAMLLMSLIISIFLISGCHRKSDFEIATDILNDMTVEMDAYYDNHLIPGKFSSIEHEAFEINDDGLYTAEEIKASWIYEENTRLVLPLKELQRLEEIIDVHDFTSFEQVNKFNAARSCDSLECQNDTGFYTFEYVGKGYIHFTFESSDGEWIETSAGYTNINLFRRHKMHVTYYYKTTDIDRSYYYEFNEDQHIIEFNYDHIKEMLQFVGYTDLESYETFEYILTTTHLPLDQTEIELSYVDYRKGIRIVWVIQNETVREYVVYAHKSFMTRSFVYKDLFYKSDVLIAYNLANYNGWDRVEITEEHTAYHIYDKNNQLIDFELDLQDYEKIYLQQIGDISQLMLEKTYDKDTLTNDDLNLKTFGLSCYDDIISLDYINTYHEYLLIYEYDFYDDLMLKDLTINELFILIDDNYIQYFE